MTCLAQLNYSDAGVAASRLTEGFRNRRAAGALKYRRQPAADVWSSEARR